MIQGAQGGAGALRGLEEPLEDDSAAPLASGRSGAVQPAPPRRPARKLYRFRGARRGRLCAGFGYAMIVEPVRVAMFIQSRVLNPRRIDRQRGAEQVGTGVLASFVARPGDEEVQRVHG